MFKFIEVTEVVGSDVKVPVMINIAHIASFKIGKLNKDTLLTMYDGKYFFIKQKPDEIVKLINEA